MFSDASGVDASWQPWLLIGWRQRAPHRSRPTPSTIETAAVRTRAVGCVRAFGHYRATRAPYSRSSSPARIHHAPCSSRHQYWYGVLSTGLGDPFGLHILVIRKHKPEDLEVTVHNPSFNLGGHRKRLVLPPCRFSHLPCFWLAAFSFPVCLRIHACFGPTHASFPSPLQSCWVSCISRKS
ncbi:hypothetical protein BC830DRAFT_1112073 [Chytriomyces sp. MP71]|nr:hypothetical protein BC830DRAFT_1112073 [Chytriomyces sp. MP71]